MLGSLLAQTGNLQGLANNFAQSGQGNAFQSWVGMGENQPISNNQIQNALSSEQVKAIATRMGVDPAVASTFLAEYLPKIVDKLTPAGKIDPTADHQQGLAALLPSLLQSLAGQSSSDQSASLAALSIQFFTLACVPRTSVAFTSSKRLVGCGRSILA
jgi:uncharacterized protein YidB (DUF937 family)